MIIKIVILSYLICLFVRFIMFIYLESKVQVEINKRMSELTDRHINDSAYLRKLENEYAEVTKSVEPSLSLKFNIFKSFSMDDFITHNRNYFLNVKQ